MTDVMDGDDDGLAPTLGHAWRSQEPLWRIVGVTAILTCSASYVGIFLFIRRIRTELRAHPGSRWGWAAVAGLIALILITLPSAGESTLGMCVYSGGIIQLLQRNTSWPRLGRGHQPGGVAGTAAVLPGPARHPRSLADRDHDQDRTGRPTGPGRSGAGRAGDRGGFRLRVGW